MAGAECRRVPKNKVRLLVQDRDMDLDQWSQFSLDQMDNDRRWKKHQFLSENIDEIHIQISQIESTPRNMVFQIRPLRYFSSFPQFLHSFFRIFASAKDSILKPQISEKVLKDLEFTTVLQQVTEFCISDLGKQSILEIQPIENKRRLLKELNATNEYLA